MNTLTRILVVFVCTSLSGLVHAHDLIRECPTSAVADSDKTQIDTFRFPDNIVWSIDDQFYVGAPDKVLELLFTGAFSLDSTCVLEGTLVFADGNSVPLAEEPLVIVGKDGMTFALYQPEQEANRQIVRYRLKDGKASGCTLEELSTVGVTATVLKRRPDVEGVCSGLACAQPQSSTQYTPYRYMQFFGVHDSAGNADTPSDVIATPQRPLDLQCRAAVRMASGYGDDGIDPFEHVWAFADGGSSTGVKQSTELVIIVTPRIIHDGSTPAGAVLNCEEHIRDAGYVVDFLPKVVVDVTVDDNKGNHFTETLELDAETQMAVRSYPYLDGGISRHLQRVKVSARGSSCFDVQAMLSTVDDDSGDTLATQRLGGVISKAVPPPAFEDGNGGEDLIQ